jgi:hypothetical protein
MLNTHFVSIMSACAILGFCAVLAVVELLDPAVTSAKLLLFASVFVAITSAMTLLGYGFRKIFSRRIIASTVIAISLRQGLLFGLASLIGLFLQGQRLLTAGNSFLLVALLAVVEYFFLSLRQTRSSTQ